ncbi:MAG: cadmium-translocating P-type ATPase [Clostridia bacterium]|nr:cadmium-translocating P-type ATPase [Clostridia bacterium]
MKKKKKKRISKKKLQLINFAIGSVIGFSCILLEEILKLNIPIFIIAPLSLLSAILMGYRTYIRAFKLIKMKVVDENLLVTISVFGALILGALPNHPQMFGSCEGLMVIFLYSIGKMLEEKAVNKSRQSISELMEFTPDYAIIKTQDGEQRVSPDEVPLGSTIIVKAGEKVALDGIIVKGNCSIDTKNLTGESLPVDVKENDTIMSGVIVLDSAIEIKTTSEFENSTVVKILNLIENASEKKSKTENFIASFSRYYTLGVIVAAIITGTITSIVIKSIMDGIYRGLGFLVCSCPCAFAISVPLTYFSGVGNASTKGILIKGTNYLDACAKISTVVFDKTGTLTTGNFEVKNIEIFESNYSYDEVLKICYLGEHSSNHPIAKAICNLARQKGIELEEIENFKEIAGKGIAFNFKNREYSIQKDLDNLDKAFTSVLLKEQEKVIAKILLQDKIKDQSFLTIKNLKKKNIKSLMLTGDNEMVANNVSSELGLDGHYSSLLPQQKFEKLENLIQTKQKNSIVAYVGDGINDAPSLALADVGISMGISGSQSSIEASDVVLVDDNPNKINTLISISKYTKKIVIQNIAFAGIVKIVALLMIALGLANLLVGVFADVGVTVLAVLNSLRALRYKSNG